MANEKSKAEQYRDERKARIAKAAKKNAHNMEKNTAAKKIVGKVISIIIIAALVLTLGGWGLSYYGVPQRLIPIGKVGSNISVSVAEYEFYYMRAYNNLVNQVQQYSQYGYDYGYDTSLAPQDQTKTTKDEDGNEITWEEYLDKQTVSMIQMYRAYAQKAEEMGLKITEADKKAIDDQLDQLKEEAASAGGSSSNGANKAGYSLNAYLRKVYGGGVNKSFLRKQMEVQTLAQKYYTERSKELKKTYDQAEIDKVYAADKDSYDLADFRIYEFSGSDSAQTEDGTADTKAAAQAKADADNFIKAVTDEKSFIAQAKAAHDKDAAEGAEAYDANTDTLKKGQLKNGDGSNDPGVTGTYSEDAANWIFDGARKAGDKTVIGDDESGRYFAIYMVTPKGQQNTVTVRHILFMTKNQETGEDLSAEEKANKKQAAEDALKQWQDGEKTAESFGEIANNLTEDTGSASNGGLYENVRQGTMVAAFNDWCFDAARKPGDTGIVETEYGYHVMYFEGNGGKYYDSAIRTTKATEDFEKESEEILKGDEYVVGLGPNRLAYAKNQVLKKIKGLVELSNANSKASSASAASNYSY